MFSAARRATSVSWFFWFSAPVVITVLAAAQSANDQHRDRDGELDHRDPGTTGAPRIRAGERILGKQGVGTTDSSAARLRGTASRSPYRESGAATWRPLPQFLGVFRRRSPRRGPTRRSTRPRADGASAPLWRSFRGPAGARGGVRRRGVRGRTWESRTPRRRPRPAGRPRSRSGRPPSGRGRGGGRRRTRLPGPGRGPAPGGGHPSSAPSPATRRCGGTPPGPPIRVPAIDGRGRPTGRRPAPRSAGASREGSGSPGSPG
jgi:hypothetical protein